ncbi:protein kinase [Nonomuraea sp. SMC257]|uniref:non-specific serine/threonine protein kinase n=2 Tax=Nonomuraea montanisoli TaxID=2741721 RepID=A0A7Y6ICT4_9ACTN|nr:protein kinase [Nonomuraea montanisoli]
MGEVWRAADTVLGRTVAVKVMMPALAENPAFARRFQNEARAMATLRHPGVVDVYDYGTCEVGGRRVSFLVMEFVEGESLDRILRARALSPAETMRLVAEVADALAAAHEQGIVHRDVKPANLMVRPDGRVALTDFGIAHSVSAGQLTATGAMLCSAAYCAPELATASAVTPAVDVYALGVVAYECLTGRLPYEGDTPVQIIYKHLHAPVPALPPEVPAGPRQVVQRALDKAPDMRWPSAAELAAAARRALAEPASRPSSRRRRGLLSGLASAAAAVTVTVAVAGSVWTRQESAADPGTVPPAPTAQSRTTSAAEPPAPRRHSAPPAKTTAGPRPSGTRTPVTPTASPTATVPTASPTPTAPTATPTTREPEPTPEPTTPDPQEPSTDPTPTRDPGDIQCVRSPCP